MAPILLPLINGRQPLLTLLSIEITEAQIDVLLTSAPTT